jgi:ADP-ribosylation factor-like protein 13B
MVEVKNPEVAACTKKRLARRDSRLRTKIHEDRKFIGARVDPVLGRILENLYIEQPENVTQFIIQQISSVQASSPSKNLPEPKLSAKKVGKRDKKKDHAYMRKQVHPVMTRIMQQLLVQKPRDIKAFLLDVLSSTAVDRQIQGSPNQKKSKMRNKIDSARQLDTEMVKADPTSKSRSRIADAQLIDSQIQNGQVMTTESHIETIGIQPVVTPSKISICVVGLNGGGKSSILNMLEGKFNTSPKPTVGFQCIKMQLSEDTVVEFFDLGGTPKIRKIWSQYFADVHGVVYVVDSTEQERSEEGVELFKSTCKHARVAGKPMLVLANKQDCEGAKTTDTLGAELGTGSMANCKLQDCSAAGEALDTRIEGGLEWLFQCVITQYPQLKQRVDSDLKAYAAEKAAEKAARARKVLKQLIERAFMPMDGEKTEVLTEEEGYKYLADEISKEVSDLDEKAKEACRLVGQQRLAIQMIGEMLVPVSKKKTPKTHDEVLKEINALRAELNVSDDAVSIPSAE